MRRKEIAFKDLSFIDKIIHISYFILFPISLLSFLIYGVIEQTAIDSSNDIKNIKELLRSKSKRAEEFPTIFETLSDEEKKAIEDVSNIEGHVFHYISNIVLYENTKGRFKEIFIAVFVIFALSLWGGLTSAGNGGFIDGEYVSQDELNTMLFFFKCFVLVSMMVVFRGFMQTYRNAIFLACWTMVILWIIIEFYSI